MPIITAWATLICGTMFLALTVRVIQARRSSGVSLGDGGDTILLRRMRGQGNAAEQMPIGLLIILMAELVGGTTLVLGLLAALFCAGRVVHAIGFGWLKHSLIARVGGMATSLVGTIALLIYLAIVLLSGAGPV